MDESMIAETQELDNSIVDEEPMTGVEGSTAEDGPSKLAKIHQLMENDCFQEFNRVFSDVTQKDAGILENLMMEMDIKNTALDDSGQLIPAPANFDWILDACEATQIGVEEKDKNARMIILTTSLIRAYNGRFNSEFNNNIARNSRHYGRVNSAAESPTETTKLLDLSGPSFGNISQVESRLSTQREEGAEMKIKEADEKAALKFTENLGNRMNGLEETTTMLVSQLESFARRGEARDHQVSMHAQEARDRARIAEASTKELRKLVSMLANTMGAERVQATSTSPEGKKVVVPTVSETPGTQAAIALGVRLQPVQRFEGSTPVKHDLLPCVLAGCEKVAEDGMCSKTGKPKKACCLEHYQMFKLREPRTGEANSRIYADGLQRCMLKGCEEAAEEMFCPETGQMERACCVSTPL